MFAYDDYLVTVTEAEYEEVPDFVTVPDVDHEKPKPSANGRGSTAISRS
jgi:hypothetical protein